ncbi:MAG: hypothetical protein ACI8X5_001828 [Planctomycetota bacterium]|jgi:hypothetical protein
MNRPGWDSLSNLAHLGQPGRIAAIGTVTQFPADRLSSAECDVAMARRESDGWM